MLYKDNTTKLLNLQDFEVEKIEETETEKLIYGQLCRCEQYCPCCGAATGTILFASAQLTIYQLFCFCFLNFFDFKVLQIQQFCCIIFIEHIGPPLIWFCNFYFNGFLTNMLYFFKNFLILFLCSALGFPNIYYSAKITG